MRDIRLLSALPVAVHDDENDAIDFVRFYIKGSMVDYVIDTETQQILSGSTAPAKFVEYRKFTRRGSDRVLAEILQKNEAGKITFCD